jgi:alkylhydroperoxidase family enzyme
MKESSRLANLGATRYVELVTRTTHSVLESKGDTPAQLRWAVFHRHMDEVPAALRSYLSKVAEHAYKITDEDVDALKRAGYSDDAIFELTASAALGAAVTRLEKGLIALHESRP